MTTGEDVVRTVTATVAGHEVRNDKPLTNLDIPEWSKFPISLYGIQPEHQAMLPIGEKVRVMLKADKLKEGKDASKPYNYFWSFVKVVEGEAPAQDAPKEAPAEQKPKASGKDTQIARSVALKAAVDWCSAIEAGDVIKTAEDFEQWLLR